MQDTRKQKMLIAGLSVLVLGAGSYFLFAGGSEPVSQDAVTLAKTQHDDDKEEPTPPKKVRPRHPSRENVEPRKDRAPREPRTAPEKGRRPPPKPKKPVKKHKYPCG